MMGSQRLRFLKEELQRLDAELMCHRGAETPYQQHLLRLRRECLMLMADEERTTDG